MTPHPATGRGANPAATLQGSRRYRLRKKKNWVASAREQGRRVCICQECMAVDSPTWVLAGINGGGGERAASKLGFGSLTLNFYALFW